MRVRVTFAADRDAQVRVYVSLAAGCDAQWRANVNSTPLLRFAARPTTSFVEPQRSGETEGLLAILLSSPVLCGQTSFSTLHSPAWLLPRPFPTTNKQAFYKGSAGPVPDCFDEIKGSNGETPLWRLHVVD